MENNAAVRRRLLPGTTPFRKAVWTATVTGTAVLAATVGSGLLSQAASAGTAVAGGTASMAGMPGMAGMAGMAGMSAGGGARTDASCPAPVSSPPLSPFTEQLPVPTRIDLRAGGTAKLSMRNGKHQFHADLPGTPTLGYAPAGVAGPDTYGGPTIEARRGVPATVSVTNSLEGHPLASSMDHTFMGMTDTD